MSNAEYFRSLRLASEGKAVPPPPASVAPLVPSMQSNEKREATRFRCSGSVEFRTCGSEIRTWGTVCDISRGGCYVEMPGTFPADSDVDMVIDINGFHFEPRGTVRVSYPLLGMGIAFTEISPEDWAHLVALLHTLGDTVPEPAVDEAPVHESGTEATLKTVADPAAVVEAIAEFLRSKPSLTREDFYHLLVKYQRSE